MTETQDANHQFLGRRFSRRTLFRGVAVTGIGLTGAAMIGCGSDDSESLLDLAKERGYVRIGFANEAPYGFANASGEVTGEAPEVAKAVLAKMGINEIDGVVTTFGALIPGLQAGRFDMIAAGMFINPGRCEQILFSDPDYCIPQAFGVKSGNPKGLNLYEDVAANSDVKLGVIAGGVEEGYAKALGVADGQIVPFDEPTSLAEGLAAGRVDAMAATSLSVRAQLERLGDSGLEITAPFVPVIDGKEQAGCGGYGFRKENEDFRDAFNGILASMKQGNEILPITEPFGFLEAEIGAARDRTAEDLCTE